MPTLKRSDIVKVREAMPGTVAGALEIHIGRVFLAGGFVRAVIAGEEPKDVDLFVADVLEGRLVANTIATMRGVELIITDNAITIPAGTERYPIQVVTRKVFPTARDLIDSFDFTVCQAAIVYTARGYEGVRSEEFYNDVKNKRLHYTGAGDVGGSMIRLLRYVSKGYKISTEEYAAMIARFVAQIVSTHPHLYANDDAAIQDAILIDWGTGDCGDTETYNM